MQTSQAKKCHRCSRAHRNGIETCSRCSIQMMGPIAWRASTVDCPNCRTLGFDHSANSSCGWCTGTGRVWEPPTDEGELDSVIALCDGFDNAP